MPQKLKTDELIEALTDPKVVHALNAVLMPSIRACIKEELGQLHGVLDKLEVNYTAQAKLITDLQGENSQLKRRVDILDAASRLTTLVVRGLPEPLFSERATGERDETTVKSLRAGTVSGLPTHTPPPAHAVVTEKAILELCNADLGLNLSPKDIEFAYRLKSKNATAPRPILVTFATRKTRNEVYERRRVLKSKVGPKVFLCENLTASASEVAWEARKLVKDRRLHSCWTSGGYVYVKRTETGKPTAVTDHNSLMATC